MRIDLQNRPSLSRLAQIILLLAFWQAGEGIVRVTHLPVPGPIDGMLLVLGLFASGKVSIGSMRRGADWFDHRHERHGAGDRYRVPVDDAPGGISPCRPLKPLR
jgi:hypothetical protein